jgi:siroheme synthase-like protein
MPPLFPIFLKLAGRRCLMVGGGRIAAQKLPSLVEAGAAVTVVSPELNEEMTAQQRDGAFVWRQKWYEAADLDGVFLVIAATANAALNQQVYQDAAARGILCNCVDQPEQCDFYYGSIVRRGDLQIAISTNGASPALAQRIRKDLEQLYDESYAEWLTWLGKVRSQYMRLRLPMELRVQQLHRLASRPVYERFQASRRRHAPEVRHG